MGDHSVIFRLCQCEGKWRRVSETDFHVARILVVHLLILAAGDRIDAPLHQRKVELKKIIAGTDIQFSESFEIDGEAMFAHACKLGLEGVVSKVRDSIYPTGRCGRLPTRADVVTRIKA
jgi:hypothetical protein